MSIPTVVFLKNGQEFDRKVGVMPAQAFTGVLDANLWDLSAEMDMAASFDRLGEAMLTDDTEHAYDILMEFTSKEQVDRRYGSGGVDSIFDGVTGTLTGAYPYANGTWTGFRNTCLLYTSRCV